MKNSIKAGIGCVLLASSMCLVSCGTKSIVGSWDNNVNGVSIYAFDFNKDLTGAMYLAGIKSLEFTYEVKEGEEKNKGDIMIYYANLADIWNYDYTGENLLIKISPIGSWIPCTKLNK